MAKLIEVPGVEGLVEFPDDMPDAAIADVIRKQTHQKTPLEANPYNPPPTSFSENHPYLAEAGKTATGAAKGFGKGVVDTVLGLTNLVRHPIDSAAGIAKGYGQQLGTELPQFAGDAYDAATHGDIGGAAGGVLGTVASLVPGEGALLKTGTRAVGGDPEAGGELGAQLAIQAATTPRVGGALRGGALSRLRSLFPDIAKADEAFKTAGPAMLRDKVMAFTRKGLRGKADAAAEAAHQDLMSAREAAVNKGATADLGQVDADLLDSAAKQAPAGVPFGPEFVNEATDAASKIDTLARGGAQPAPPAGWTPPNWSPAPPPGPRGPVPIQDVIDAYDAASKRIPDSAFQGGAIGDRPRIMAMKKTRAGLSDALKDADPNLGAAMDTAHEKMSVADLVNTMRSGPSGGMTRRVLEAGTVAGLAGTGHLPYAAGAAAAAGLVHVLESPAWKTVSSVVQDQVGQLVQSGQVGAALALAESATRSGQPTNQ